MNNTEKLNILHVLHVSENRTSGVRNVVPKHLEYQANLAKVALLNCNNTEVEEAKGKYDVFKLGEVNNKKIKNLPQPFNKPDLVVFHTIYYPQYIDLYKQCKKENIPYIIIPHGSLTKEAQKQKWFKKLPANMFLFNRFINNAVAIQYLIEGEMEKSRRVNKYIIAGNGIELNSERKEYNKENKVFKIIYIGRYDTYTKGLDILIKAAVLIKEFLRENNIKIILYGTDYRGRKQQIEEIINYNKVSDIVKLNGPIWGKEKVNTMCKSDLFIQPSRTEGQPIGLMEAIEIGLPCIITEETNYGKIIEKEQIGWLAETNEKSIAQKIIEAYDNKDKFEQISQNAKKYAANNFDWNVIAKKTIKNYAKIIKENEERKCLKELKKG